MSTLAVEEQPIAWVEHFKRKEQKPIFAPEGLADVEFTSGTLRWSMPGP